MSHVAGRTIAITGAGSGFGRLVARRVAALGARVVAMDIDEAGLGETVGSIEGQGGNVVGMMADVTDRGAVQAAVASGVERFGSIDVMVNNAGIMPLAFFSDHAAAADAWDRCIDINLKGVLNGIIAVHDQMIEQGRGHIVNISSIYGNQPVVGAAVYGATKAAVAFVSEALRQESQGRIKVTTVRPTGVPGTGLGEGIVNAEALVGILGTNTPEFMNDMAELMGDNPPVELSDDQSITYLNLSPELLADQIVYVINQPWGVSISDITVRASGDRYII